MALDEQFWQGERQQLLQIVAPRLQQAALDGAEAAVRELVDLAGVGVDWGLLNTAVHQWAGDYSFELVSGINDTTRKFLQQAVQLWQESGQPLDALIESLRPAFGDVRAEMIASTEVTRAFHEGNLASWKESGVVDGWRFMTVEDDLVCPECGPLDGKEFVLSDQGSAPPIHPRCRCYSQPVVRVP